MSNVTAISTGRPDLHQAFTEAMNQLHEGICVLTVARGALDARLEDLAVETEALRVGLRLLGAGYNALDSALVRLANEGAPKEYQGTQQP